VLNAANEVAVAAFLDGKLKLPDIARINARVMRSHETKAADSLDGVLGADREARTAAEAFVSEQRDVGHGVVA
jgi:1-deoxy-D-xylulose-5-phosphate reductoisomerase